MALSDAEVSKQIQHMVEFINKEAGEKVEEIDTKAEEEFNIEKGRLLQQEKLKVKSYFERKEKQVEMQRKIQRSNQQNQARLSILKSRDDNVDKILSDAAKKLGEITKDQAKYQQIISSLIAQGLFQLIEPHVNILCRKQDMEVVKAAIPAGIDQYTKATRVKVVVEINKVNFLPEECSGGVILYDKTHSISVSNTFESRLELLSKQMIPEIRGILFGASLTRKFYD
ncbi:V-type proton ATPase subunit E 1 [Oopsacas minuta]|uniref:V-type proton ATPase subunit E 1 n=1 Tax=Oopsacas minuta TaxID=111878 RepID=A0AAV7JWP7_9METZ|nr:V-type proton ATPase subunit E 1 [Oopsacas minuta]